MTKVVRIIEMNENDQVTRYRSPEGEFFREFDDQGREIKLWDSNGFMEFTTYLETGEFIVRSMNCVGKESIRTYRSDNKLESLKGYDGYHRIYYYDENGRLDQTDIQLNPEAEWNRYQYHYDANGRQEKLVRIPFPGGDDE